VCIAPTPSAPPARPPCRAAGLAQPPPTQRRISSGSNPPPHQRIEAVPELDRYDLLILDDLSYVRKDQAETSVLFELIAERYERRSILITANQPFSGWNNVFPDPGMTVAAIDRLVHHSTIFELNKVQSYRGKVAARQQQTQRANDKAQRRRQSPDGDDNQPTEVKP
jgi:hypothetical protein